MEEDIVWDDPQVASSVQTAIDDDIVWDEPKPLTPKMDTAQAFVGGMKRLPLGFLRLGQDAYNEIQKLTQDEELTPEEYATFASDWIGENEQRISQAKQSLGYKEDDIFTPDMFGQVFTDLATLPAAALKGIKGLQWFSKLSFPTQGAISGGAFGTVSALGEGKEYGEATVQGAIEGAIGMGLGFIPNKSTTFQALDYIKKASGETPAQLKKYEEEYAKAISKDVSKLTDEDRLMAIVNNSELGKRFKVEAEFFDQGTMSKRIFFEEKAKKTIEDAIGEADVNFPVAKLQEYLQDTSNMYADTLSLLNNKFDTEILVPKQRVAGIIEAIEASRDTQNTVVVDRIIRDLVDGTDVPLDMQRLLNMRQDINSLNVKAAKGMPAKQVKSFVKDLVSEHLSKQPDGDVAISLWEEANKRYSAKKILEDGSNWISELMLKKGNKKLSADDFTKKIMSQPERGSYYFNQIRDVIGEEASGVLERKIVKDVTFNKTNFKDAMEYLKGFEFVTKEGKSLQSELQRIEGAFPDESAISLLSRNLGLKTNSVGWSDNLVNKAKYSLIGKLWDGITKRMPFNEGAEAERAFARLAKVLQKQDIDIKIDIKKDKELAKAFYDEQANLKSQMDILKNKPNKTATDGETIMDLNRAMQIIDRYVPKTSKKEAQNAQLAMNKAEITVNEIQGRINSLDNMLDGLYEKLSVKPTRALELKIERGLFDLKNAHKKLDVAEQNHAKLAEKFNNMNIDLENMREFDPSMSPASRPDIQRVKPTE